MLKAILGIGGAVSASVVTYILAYKKGHKDGETEGFEYGTQAGFAMAPALYNQMKNNGDIDKIPIGISLGERGRIFKTVDDAKRFIEEAARITGCRVTDFDCWIMTTKNENLQDVVVVSQKGDLRKG